MTEATYDTTQLTTHDTQDAAHNERSTARVTCHAAQNVRHNTQLTMHDTAHRPLPTANEAGTHAVHDRQNGMYIQHERLTHDTTRFHSAQLDS